MRVQNWRAALSNVVEAARAIPFVWGTNDCGQFPGRCVAAITGANPWAATAGTYSDEAGAMAILAAMGVDDMDGFAAHYLTRYVNDAGLDAPFMALTGDLGIVVRNGKKSLTVCLGAHCATPGIRCLMMVPRSEMIAAFKVI